MSIFKHIPDGYRLRCNRYNAKGKNKCTHKINVPLPGNAFKIAHDPLDSVQTNGLATAFSWNKMRFSKDTVSIVAYLSVMHSIPAPQIADIMNQLFNLTISHDTVTRWSHKIALNLHNNLGPLSVNASNQSHLFVDETRFAVRGNKRWLWAGKDSRFDSIQTWFISPRRATNYARSTFNIAFSHSPSLKSAHVVTDGLHSYPSALGDLGYNIDEKHIRNVGFEGHTSNSINNNRIERLWSDFKTAAAAFRGFKSELGLFCFVTSRTYRHNYFTPNSRLNGKTPAQAAGKKLPYCHNTLKLLLKFL